MATTKRVFTLPLEDYTYDKIGVLATREHRSMANCIEYILMDYISKIEQEQGEIKPEGESYE